jgi:hypothetical protein
MADPRAYYYFYMLGRRDDELSCDIDIATLAERVFGGESLRQVCYSAAEDAAAAHRHSGFERDWKDENRSEIGEAGGNAERAFKLYRQGQVDELAYCLEAEVINEVHEALDDIDLGDGDGDGDDDDRARVV